MKLIIIIDRLRILLKDHKLRWIADTIADDTRSVRWGVEEKLEWPDDGGEYETG